MFSLRARRLMAVLALFFVEAGWGESNGLPHQGKARIALGKREGCVVLMEARTGRLLAAWPPENAGKAIAAPGSTFKLLVAIAALEAGSTTPTQRVECRNRFPLEQRMLWCSKTGGHGSLNLAEAIAHSCNIHFYTLGLRLGSKRLLKWAHLFGLGHKTGSGLAGEEAGSLPGKVFHPVEVAWLAIGQGRDLRVTTLQMASLTAAIANRGSLYKPFISGNSTLIRRIRFRDPDIWKVLHAGMKLAVEHGTARRAALREVAVAGKTGSPERIGSPEARDGWFIGFAPADRPEVAIAVYVARGRGGDDAAPIARKMLEGWRQEK